MSMTIYGGMTINGVEIDDCVDNSDDIVFQRGEYFARSTKWRRSVPGSNIPVYGPAIAIFHEADPWTPLFALKTERDYDESSKEFNTLLDITWRVAESYGVHPSI